MSVDLSTSGPTRDHRPPSALSARGLVAGYHDRRTPVPIVGPVDLDVRAGTFTAVLGPNGAGKTTLLRTLAGVMRPLDGTVSASLDDGGEAPLRRLSRDALARHIAVVLTDHPDVGLLRARDIVAIGRHPHTGWSGRLDAHDRQVVADALHAVGAADLDDVEMARMSDGQRQRVWIARALAQEPQVLLLDEPTAYLDLPGRLETLTLLRDVSTGQRDLAVVASIHDLDLALRIADQVWLIDRDGVLSAGAPEDLALSGAIDRAFGRDDVRFDVATASFELPVDCCCEVSLVGVDGRAPDPTMALWTGRALTRAGAIILGGAGGGRPAWFTVTVPDEIADGWVLSTPERSWSFATLGGLAAGLRQMTASPVEVAETGGGA